MKKRLYIIVYYNNKTNDLFNDTFIGTPKYLLNYIDLVHKKHLLYNIIDLGEI